MVDGQLYSQPVVACQVAIAVVVQLAGNGLRAIVALGMLEFLDRDVVVLAEDSWRSSF